MCRENDFIRKIRLISKFKLSKPGSQTIAIHILTNISRSKDKQAIKFGQLMEYNKKNKTPDHLVSLKKALHEVKASGLLLNFKIFQ